MAQGARPAISEFPSGNSGGDSAVLDAETSDFSARSRKTRISAETYSCTSHKEIRSLTLRLQKITVSGSDLQHHVRGLEPPHQRPRLATLVAPGENGGADVGRHVGSELQPHTVQADHRRPAPRAPPVLRITGQVVEHESPRNPRHRPKRMQRPSCPIFDLGSGLITTPITEQRCESPQLARISHRVSS